MTLSFITTSHKMTEEAKDVTKHSILELNNSLVMPMKILKINYLESKNADWTDINIEVEDCADIQEWDLAVANFLIGTEWKKQLLVSSLRKNG